MNRLLQLSQSLIVVGLVFVTQAFAKNDIDTLTIISDQPYFSFMVANNNIQDLDWKPAPTGGYRAEVPLKHDQYRMNLQSGPSQEFYYYYLVKNFRFDGPKVVFISKNDFKHSYTFRQLDENGDSVSNWEGLMKFSWRTSPGSSSGRFQKITQKTEVFINDYIDIANFVATDSRDKGNHTYLSVERLPDTRGNHRVILGQRGFHRVQVSPETLALGPEARFVHRHEGASDSTDVTAKSIKANVFASATEKDFLSISVRDAEKKQIRYRALVKFTAEGVPYIYPRSDVYDDPAPHRFDLKGKLLKLIADGGVIFGHGKIFFRSGFNLQFNVARVGFPQGTIAKESMKYQLTRSDTGETLAKGSSNCPKQCYPVKIKLPNTSQFEVVREYYRGSALLSKSKMVVQHSQSEKSLPSILGFTAQKMPNGSTRFDLHTSGNNEHPPASTLEVRMPGTQTWERIALTRDSDQPRWLVGTYGHCPEKIDVRVRLIENTGDDQVIESYNLPVL